MTSLNSNNLYPGLLVFPVHLKGSLYYWNLYFYRKAASFAQQGTIVMALCKMTLFVTTEFKTQCYVQKAITVHQAQQVLQSTHARPAPSSEYLQLELVSSVCKP